MIFTLCRLQTSEVCHRLSTSPPAGREVTACSRSQLEMLMNENKRLKQELEGHTEKALRIQKVKAQKLKLLFVNTFFLLGFGQGSGENTDLNGTPV